MNGECQLDIGYVLYFQGFTKILCLPKKTIRVHGPQCSQTKVRIMLFFMY